MPLLDAAIAFALTMLGLSSLVGMIQEALHQARHVRSRHLEIMLRRWLEECLIDGSNAPLVSDDSADLSDELWQRLGLEPLLEEIRSGKCRRLSTRHLFEALDGPLKALDGTKRRALAEAWRRLGDEQTEIFRGRAKISATVGAVVLAFGLNIDSLHLLEGFMSRGLEESRAHAARSDGSTPAPDPLRIGWHRFPNCPATSTDPRCLVYWSGAAGGSGAETLSFEQRRALNPTRHPRAALGLFSSAHNPTSTADHMATDGGPPEDGGARFLPQVPSTMLGHLSWWSVWAWFLGCLLTAVLAGLGSPFWIEVVRRLALTRDNLREARIRAQGITDEELPSRPDQLDPMPGTPTDTEPGAA